MTGAESKRCQLCGNESLERFEIPRQNILWKCSVCGLYQYGLAGSEKSYESPDYHADYMPQRRRKVRTATVRLNRISALLKQDSARLLDVGCGIGAVLEAARQRGWRPVGAEISRAVVTSCRKQGFECELIENDRLPFAQGTFDVVTAWSVIEHVLDVRETLAEWRRVLRPGGILAIDTSTAECWKARLLGARYRGFWPHGHTYTFTASTLRRLVTEAGFRVLPGPLVGDVSQLPWGEAAYCVAYQLQYELRQWLRIQKPFMLFAERVDSTAAVAAAA